MLILKLKKMIIKKNKLLIFVLFVFLGSILSFKNIFAATLADNLSGRIVLQVEAKGEAYYISPIDKKAYYLARPNDAFSIMRSFGLGVSNNDLLNFLKNGARSNLSGRILLQVEDKGQAYYVNPLNLRLYYLGRPIDAFNLMRQLGLGISNQNLLKINIGTINLPSIESPNTPTPKKDEKLVKFSWKYKNKNYNLNQLFSDNLYKDYSNSNKNFYYSSENPPSNLRDSYYALFLEVKNNDKSIELLLKDLKNISDREAFSDDEFVEFVMAFVQYIPYDFSKIENGVQNFPYETLYKNSGVCSDKAFLAALMLRKMGYGSAIFDYPNAKHSAVAVSCDSNSSYNSTYCFIETTNYFPVGVFPGEINDGKAEALEENFNNVFNGSYLGPVEIYQKKTGRIYTGMNNVLKKVDTINKMNSSVKLKEADLKKISEELNNLKAELDSLLLKMDEYNRKKDISNYNLSAAEYNTKVDAYNNMLNNYKLKLEIFNNDIFLLNKTIKDFYQN